jgi:predicted RNA-binding protein YlxR (DUF448 family)/ribosomal protein L7Ae-like RNA K-turn-binding protein
VNLALASAGDTPPPDAPASRHRSERTCVGCGAVSSPDELVRIITSPDGALAVDLAGGKFGRGAWVHPAPACVAKAPAGLSRTFKRKVQTSGEELARLLVVAAHRRAEGLVSAACRSQNVVVGAEMAGRAMGEGKARLLLVAADAPSALTVPAVERAVSRGDAVVWGTKEKLGALVSRPEVSVLGIESRSLAAGIQRAVVMADRFGSAVTAAEVR